MNTTFKNQYRNLWHKSLNVPKPEFYQNNAPQVRPEYRSVKVYKLFDRGYDFVFAGCCITQRAGVTRYREVIDELLDGKSPCSDEVANHIRTNGEKAITYSEFSLNSTKHSKQP